MNVGAGNKAWVLYNSSKRFFTEAYLQPWAWIFLICGINIVFLVSPFTPLGCEMVVFFVLW